MILITDFNLQEYLITLLSEYILLISSLLNY